MPKLVVIEASGERREIEAQAGLSVMEALAEVGIATFGECGGSLACGTCHVVVEPDWFERLPPPSEAEEDMLDAVFNLTVTSRLCCQITVTEACDGLTVRFPGADAAPATAAATALAG